MTKKGFFRTPSWREPNILGTKGKDKTPKTEKIAKCRICTSPRNRFAALTHFSVGQPGKNPSFLPAINNRPLDYPPRTFRKAGGLVKKYNCMGWPPASFPVQPHFANGHGPLSGPPTDRELLASEAPQPKAPGLIPNGCSIFLKIILL